MLGWRLLWHWYLRSRRTVLETWFTLSFGLLRVNLSWHVNLLASEVLSRLVCRGVCVLDLDRLRGGIDVVTGASLLEMAHLSPYLAPSARQITNTFLPTVHSQYAYLRLFVPSRL